MAAHPPDAGVASGPDHDLLGEGALVSAARLGDRAAFETLVRAHGPVMLRYARRMVRDAGEAQDAVQEALVAAWLGMPRFQGRSSVRTWLLGLTAHKAADSARRTRAQPTADWMFADTPAGPESDPERHVTQAELLSRIEVALAELPYRQRACWVLSEVDGLSTAEIAEVVGLNPGAVRGQLHRARRNLTERMSRWR